MKKSFFIMLLALALLSGCGAANNENIFVTRTASDEEAFNQVMEFQDAEEIELEDDGVPLSGQPGQAPEEGWLLVRYAAKEDGTVEPLWYRVWMQDGVWSQETLPYEGTDWNPVLPGSVK